MLEHKTLILQQELSKKFNIEPNDLRKHFFRDTFVKIISDKNVSSEKIELVFDYFRKQIDTKDDLLDIETKKNLVLNILDEGKFQTFEKYIRHGVPDKNEERMDFIANFYDIKIDDLEIDSANFNYTFENIDSSFEQHIKVIGERNQAYNNKTYHKIIESAKKRIDIISITGEKIYIELLDMLKYKLLNESVRIRLLTINPINEFMKIRQNKLGKNSTADFYKFSDKLKFQLPNILYKFKEENIDAFSKNDSVFEHNYYDDIPYFGYIRVDNQIIYEIYSSHQKSKRALVLNFDKNTLPLFEYLTEHFNSLWYTSKPKFRIDNSTLPENIYDEITGLNSSFAPYTIEKRFPKIISDLLKQIENKKFEKELEDLKTISTVDYIFGQHKEYKIWNKYIARYVDKSILDVPFIFAEFYFYWKIIEKTKYFENKIDPFKIQKQESSYKAVNSIATLIDFINDKSISIQNKWEKIFINLLWSNREGDLSQISMQSANKSNEIENILINDISETFTFIKNNCYQIDFILDNSGYELSATLVLVYFLLENDLVKDINLHAKKYPFFVSDTTKEDINFILDIFKKHDNKNTQYVAKKLEIFFGNNIKIFDDSFWCEPLYFSDERIKNSLYRSHLVIIQGDLNYRRLIGDRLWAYDMDIKMLTKYFPTNVLIVRTLKSEVLVNIPLDKIKEISQKNKKWLVDGSYGIIQLVEKQLY